MQSQTIFQQMPERAGIVGLDLRYAVASRLRVGAPKDALFEARQTRTQTRSKNKVNILDFGFWILDCSSVIRLCAGGEQAVMLGDTLFRTWGNICEGAYLGRNMRKEGTHLVQIEGGQRV